MTDLDTSSTPKKKERARLSHRRDSGIAVKLVFADKKRITVAGVDGDKRFSALKLRTKELCMQIP